MSYAAFEKWKHTRLPTPPDITVVMTTRADEAHLLRAVDRVGSYFCRQRFVWDLVVCLASDQKEMLARLKALKYANLVIVEAQDAGSALQKGMGEARGALILYDNQVNSTPIEEVERLLPALIEQQYDVAVGVRLEPPQRRNPLIYLGLVMLGQARRTLLRLVFRNPVSDPDSGFCLYSGPVARRLFLNLTHNRIPPNLEALYLAGKIKAPVLEVPVGWARQTRKGPPVRKTMLQLMPDLIRVLFNDLRGKYKVLSHD